MPPVTTSRPARAIVEFCRFARANGMRVGVQETVVALQAARSVGIADRETFRLALRAVLCSSKEEWDIFEEIFQKFWLRQEEHPASTVVHRKRRQRLPRSEERETVLTGAGERAQPSQEAGKAVAGATAHERLRKTDLSQVPLSDLAELEQLAQRLLRQMCRRVSRRLKSGRPRGRVDLRRTVRRSMMWGGDPIALSYRDRRAHLNRLVILLDISGSMNAYSLFLMKFAYALQRHFQRVHTFTFSTQLADITAALRSRQLPEMLEAVSQQAAGWSGGTKIGESLREFNHGHARKLLSRNAVFIVLSDGWDTGEPEVLAGELNEIRRCVRSVIWLNPLLGIEGYQPVTRAMSAALPYVDIFAPAHNLESLLQLESYLKQQASR